MNESGEVEIDRSTDLARYGESREVLGNVLGNIRDNGVERLIVVAEDFIEVEFVDRRAGKDESKIRGFAGAFSFEVKLFDER